MTESPNLNQKPNLDFISSSEISEVFCFIFQNSNALVLGCFWLKDKSCKTFDIMSTKSVFFFCKF
jgi:G:T-mismatch repair DNA endonuclease (very short patch repair protein)